MCGHFGKDQRFDISINTHHESYDQKQIFVLS